MGCSHKQINQANKIIFLYSISLFTFLNISLSLLFFTMFFNF